MPPKVASPNAMWADWVQEAADQAAAKGSKAAESYGKAARAIRIHKEKMHHPSEAIQLPGVGPKVVEMITSRLQTWCKNNLEDFPQRVPDQGGRKRAETDGNEAGPARKRGKTKEARTFEGELGETVGLRRDPMPVDHDDPIPGPSNARKAAARKKGSAKAPKAYVPKPRSGGWGILVALYGFCTEESQKKFRTKAEIVDEAQPYCDGSYSTAEGAKGGGQGASSYITCWSAMKVLVNKEYVVETNTRPKQWAITRQGFEVAEVIARQEGLRMLAVDLTAVTAKSAEEAEVEAGKRSKGKGKAPVAAQRAGPSSEGLLNGHGSDPPLRRAPNKDEQRWLAHVSDDVVDQEEEDVRRVLELSVADQTGKRAATSAFPNLDAGRPSKQHPSSSGPAPASKPLMKRTFEEARAYKAPRNVTTDSLGEKPFEFFYLDASNRRVKEQNSAECSVSDTAALSFKIEFRKAQSLHPFASANVRNIAPFPPSVFARPVGPEGSTQIGWLADAKAVPRAPGFAALSATALAAIGRQKAVDDLMMGQRSTDKLDPKAMYARPPAPKPAATSSIERTRSAPTAPADATRPNLDRRNLSSQPDLPSSSNPTPPAPAATAAVLTRPSSPPHPMAKRAQPVASGSRPRGSFATAGAAPPGPPKPRASTGRLDALAATIQPIVWPAGSYDVVLLLDNRELAGKANRQGIAERCEKVLGPRGMGQRALAVGDALWVARDKLSGKEVAMDEVLERKRLDDLCSSIKDQRFHEQKARLKSSGLKNLTYLVEDFDRQVHQTTFGQQIWTAKTQVMVLDGFHLHETKSWKDSADYLILKTQVLSDLHRHIALSVIPDAHIDRSSYLALLGSLRRSRPSSTFVTSYDTFHQLNDKSANLTVSDVWARMIASVSGFSAEKVGAVVERWPTPRGFWESYKERKELAGAEAAEWEEEQRQREEAGGGSKGKGKGRKRKRPNPETWVGEELPADYRGIGPILSKKMWTLWDAERY